MTRNKRIARHRTDMGTRLLARWSLREWKRGRTLMNAIIDPTNFGLTGSTKGEGRIGVIGLTPLLRPCCMMVPVCLKAMPTSSLLHLLCLPSFSHIYLCLFIIRSRNQSCSVYWYRESVWLNISRTDERRCLKSFSASWLRSKVSFTVGWPWTYHFSGGLTL